MVTEFKNYSTSARVENETGRIVNAARSVELATQFKNHSYPTSASGIIVLKQSRNIARSC